MNSPAKSYLLVLLCLFLVSCTATIGKPEDCPASFADYAYSGNKAPVPLPLPASWKKITEIPIDVNQWSWLEIALIRAANQETEIWLKEPDSNIYFDSEADRYRYYIYNVERDELQTVSAAIPNTDAYAMRLFLTGDGAIWAQNFWDTKNAQNLASKYPLLSKFNHVKRKFELVTETQGIDAFRLDSDLSASWNKIVYADKSFWIFAHEDAIYTFDPVSSTIAKRLEIPSLEVQDAAFSPNEKNFYLQIDRGTLFSVTQGEYVEYIPGENRLLELTLPKSRWPASSSVLVDHSGKLWLSAVGWYLPDRQWHLLYPNPLRFFWNMQFEGNYAFTLPEITFESSDNRLWFSSAKGMAWLEESATQGCWFTTYPSTVAEDSNHNLWAIVDKKLYKYSLGN